MGLRIDPPISLAMCACACASACVSTWLYHHAATYSMTDGDFADAKRVFIEAKRVNMAKIKAEGDAGFKATEHMGATGM